MTLKGVYSKYSVNGSYCYSCRVLFYPSPHGPFQPHFVYGKVEQRKWPGDFLQPELCPKLLILSPLCFYSILPYTCLFLGHSWAFLRVWSKPWTFISVVSLFSYASFAGWEGSPLAIRTASHSHRLLPSTAPSGRARTRVQYPDLLSLSAPDQLCVLDRMA